MPFFEELKYQSRHYDLWWRGCFALLCQCHLVDDPSKAKHLAWCPWQSSCCAVFGLL